MGRLELEFPTSSAMRSLGLRPSAFIDAGSLWNIKEPILTDIVQCLHTQDADTGQPSSSRLPGDPACDSTLYNITPGIKEVFVGNSAKPRLSIGVGVNWNSPFGPLRIDIAKALLKQKGDDTKLFSFNVGTSILMKNLLLPPRSRHP